MKFKKALASKMEALDEAGYRNFDYFWPFITMMAVGVPLLIVSGLITLAVHAAASVLASALSVSLFTVLTVVYFFLIVAVVATHIVIEHVSDDAREYREYRAKLKKKFEDEPAPRYSWY